MLTEEEVQAARLLRNDFPTFCKTLLRIKTKRGKVVPFELNRSQMYVWKTIKRMEAEGRPVRIVILKARQLGMSTMIQAYLLWRALTCPGHSGLVVAHAEDPASELFSKIELMYRHLPEDMYSELESIKDSRRQGKKLGFGGDLNTLLYVDTAGNPSLGRSQTFQHVHLSEMAFYDKADDIMFGLEQSVPREEGTTIIVETTANGTGNYFHSMWGRAESGESSYTPVFLPWHWDEGNVAKVPTDFKRTAEERKLAAKYNLTNKQLQWRREVIEDACGGDVDKFNQEHPGEPRDAFILSGSPYFNVKSLIAYRNGVKEPIKEGFFELSGTKPVLVTSKGGQWRVWERPSPDRSYIIGADVAGGTAKDYSAAHVLDIDSLTQVASFRGKLDPDEFARELKWMGLAYNKALICVEKNGEGRATVLKLVKDLHYPRMFFHMNQENWNGGVQKSWGWTTSARTRPTMLAQLSELIRSRQLRVYDDRTVDELEAFIRVHGQRVAEAGPGAWDDMVMALAIAVNSETRSQIVREDEGIVYDYEPAVSELTGY